MSECHNKRVTALAVTRDALWSAGSTNGLLLLHSLQTMQLLGKIYFPAKGSDTDFVTALASVQRTVWAGSSDGSLVIFDSESQQPTEVTSCHSQAIFCIAAGEDCVFVGSADGVISIYTPATAGTWQCAGTLRHHQAAVRALVTAPGGRLWSGGDDHVVAVTDVRTGAVLMRMVDAAGPVLTLVAAADHIWSGSADRRIRCYHQQSGRAVRDISAHQAWVTGLATAPTTLWSCSTDRTIGEWDLVSGHPVGEALEVPGGKLVWCVAALQDDSLIAAGLGDGRVLMLQRSSEGLRVCEGFAASTTAQRLGSDTLDRQKAASSAARQIEVVSFALPMQQTQTPAPAPTLAHQEARPARQQQDPSLDHEPRQQEALEHQHRQREQAQLLEQQQQRLQEQKKQLEQALEAQRTGLEKEHSQMLATQAALERQTRELQLERQQREQQMQAAAQLETRLRALMGERSQFQGMVGSLKAQLTDLTSGLERIREEAPPVQDAQRRTDEHSSATAGHPTSNAPSPLSSQPTVSTGSALRSQHSLASHSIPPTVAAHEPPLVPSPAAPRPSPSQPRALSPQTQQSHSPQPPPRSHSQSQSPAQSHLEVPVAPQPQRSSSYTTLDRLPPPALPSSQTHFHTFSHDLPSVAPTSQTPTMRGWAAPAPSQLNEPAYAPRVLSPIAIDPNDADALLKIEAMRRELDRQFQETQRAAQLIKYQAPPL